MLIQEHVTLKTDPPPHTLSLSLSFQILHYVLRLDCSQLLKQRVCPGIPESS